MLYFDETHVSKFSCNQGVDGLTINEKLEVFFFYQGIAFVKIC